MIHTDRAIVVEGKYDKIKLSGMIDGVIVCTGGFRIYKDKEMQAMLRTLANKQGLAVLTDSDAAGFQIRGFIRNICGKEKIRIYKDKEMQAMLRTLANKQGLAVLTDSDAAGFQIRGFIRNICGKEKIVDVYIPDLYGKEKRKQHPSKEGKLGVEGIPEQLLQKAFEEAGVGVQQVQRAAQPITKMDLFELGLSGTADSAQRRKQLMRHLNLPEHLTTNALVTVLAALMTREELYSQCSSLLMQEEE